MQKSKVNWGASIFLILGSAMILFPLYITIVIALKNPQEIAQSVLSLPKKLHFENFIIAIKMTRFFRSFTNSFIITVSGVALTILTNSMVAYAIARNMHKKFFKFLYFYFVSALFIPFAIIMLPIVKQTSAMGIDNKWGLIFLYIVYGLAFNIFLYVAYIKSIPISLEEAAILDGCNVWQVFWKIVFPLMAPINSAVMVLSTLWLWNDFLLPLVLLSKRDDMTLQLVQYVFQSQFRTDYNLAFASYLMAMAPLIIIYTVAQKWVVSGITKGSIK